MLSLVTPAAEDPVSILEARNHCRASDTDDDVLSLYLAAATQAVKDHTGRALIAETWQLSAVSFGCGPLVLPRAPLLGVTEVRIWDGAGADILVAPAEYQVEAPAGPLAPSGRLHPAPSGGWPAVQTGRLDAVRVTFEAGYGATDKDVPAPLRAAILLLTGTMYENREADAVKALTETPAVKRLLSPYTLHWI